MAGANVHDIKLLALTLESIVAERPDGSDEGTQHLLFGQRVTTIQRATRWVVAQGYRGHIRRIGEEETGRQRGKTLSCFGGVVERTLAWLSKCRAILVRYDKKDSNYIGLIKLACALSWYRR